ncbi:hypothetical protein [Alicyclobacillus fodiniaquatilis]|uniref:Uncharacterized protein n=1 Tax=Alicyclobacillus fodiniaquatilis TaxID=1661150 RepID=A0ABW4JD93_9BACL
MSSAARAGSVRGRTPLGCAEGSSDAGASVEPGVQPMSRLPQAGQAPDEDKVRPRPSNVGRWRLAALDGLCPASAGQTGIIRQGSWNTVGGRRGYAAKGLGEAGMYKI